MNEERRQRFTIRNSYDYAVGEEVWRHRGVRLEIVGGWATVASTDSISHMSVETLDALATILWARDYPERAALVGYTIVEEPGPAAEEQAVS